MRALLFLLEGAARLALVVALLFVSNDSRLAATLAVGASLASVARSFVRGELVKRELERAWRELVAGVRRQDVSELQTYRETDEGVAMMVDAVREVALLRATSAPEIAAQLVGLAVVAALVVARLSPAWLAVGVGLAMVLAVVVRLAQRRQSTAQARAYASLGGLARDARALVEAAAELRVMSREAALATRLVGSASSMAREERTALRFGAAMGLGPSLVALVSLTLPPHLLGALAERSHVVDLGVLGGAAISMAMGLVHALEGRARSAPYRETFDRVAAVRGREPSPAAVGLPIEIVSLDVERLSVRHPGASLATPSELTFSLSRGGVALEGENGSGKSSALLAILGLLPKAKGVVRVNGEEVGPDDVERLRARVSYLPQRPYVAPGESLRWHAELVVDDEPRMLAALSEVGLRESLESRVPAGRSILDLGIGTLSGGERQRFFIARTLARSADVVVLDEPEAGVDAAARSLLRALFAEIARARLVLLVAHDVAVVPAGFAKVRCRPEEGTT